MGQQAIRRKSVMDSSEVVFATEPQEKLSGIWEPDVSEEFLKMCSRPGYLRLAQLS